MKQTLSFVKKNGILSFEEGFTLLEVLVVIAIIGILIAMGVASFSTVQKKGRDAKRMGDIKALQNAFEQYYSGSVSGYATCNQMRADGDTLPGGAPVDPKEKTDYPCTNLSDGYCVCAQLDDPNAGNSGDANCGFSGTGFYCLRNLQ